MNCSLVTLWNWQQRVNEMYMNAKLAPVKMIRSHSKSKRVECWCLCQVLVSHVESVQNFSTSAAIEMPN